MIQVKSKTVKGKSEDNWIPAFARMTGDADKSNKTQYDIRDTEMIDDRVWIRR